MSKGDQTREMIVQKAAEVFNRQGYYGAAMSDIMAATGLEKGGIYNHFKSKDELALQAYEYAVDLVRAAFADAIKGKYHAADRLKAIVSVFQELPKGILPGGCPLMNTAVAADTHPQLHQCARQTLDEWHDFIVRITRLGRERAQLKADTDPKEVATLIIAMLEGAIMLTRLDDDVRHMEWAVSHVSGYIDSLVLAA